MTIKKTITKQAKNASHAAGKLSYISSKKKNKALSLLTEKLKDSESLIIEENNEDIKKAQTEDYSSAFIDRLQLNENRIDKMIKVINEVIEHDDPVGNILEMWKRPNGLKIGQMSVPLGVIGIIYESRPDVTVEATTLCLKAGNAVILRGGSAAYNSNKILSKLIKESAAEAGLPPAAIQFINTVKREAVDVLFNLNEYLDVLIPRGGRKLINKVIDESKVPVIETGVGNCHIYVDCDADLEMALDIVDNAKTSRPAVCNAAESLIVHKNVAEQFLPLLQKRFSDKGVEIRGDKKALEILPEIKEAVEEDWYREYLDYIIALKIVADYQEAVEHINKYGSGHSEAIVTSDYFKSQNFINQIDAAAVYVNASTRFTDGNQYGLGAEIGISTQKLHARGPMGLKELTTTKYVVFGTGQIR